jgi:hypothetical protein
MPDDKSRLDRRYATAQSKLSAAEASVRKASASALAKLLALSLDRRLRVLAKPTPDLTDEDRERLAASVRKGQSAPPHPKTAPAAKQTSFALRSGGRLLQSTVILGLTAAYAALLVAIAVYNTPEQWVRFDPKLNIEAHWALGDGTPVAVAGSEYQLYRPDGDGVLLRAWIPRVGYAQTRIAAASLVQAD